MVSPDHKVDPQPQTLPTWTKHVKNIKKHYFLLRRGTQQLLHRQSIAVCSLNCPK